MEAIDDLLEVLDRAQAQLEREAVLAGDALAGNDLAPVARDLRDLAQLLRR